MSKRVLPDSASLRADTQEFFNVLNDEGDFAAIVVTVAFLDACVASVLKSRLSDSSVTDKLLDSRRGPLGSFAARVDMAYALKLIDQPMYQDVLQYAEIRNIVAHHHVSVSFDVPEISAACQKLKYLLTMKNGDLDEMAFTEEQLPPPRERYKFTAVHISNLLLVQAEEKGRGNAA